MTVVPKKKRELLVRRFTTREIVHRVDVSDKSTDTIVRVMRGMLINMSNEFFIDDSET